MRARRQGGGQAEASAGAGRESLNEGRALGGAPVEVACRNSETTEGAAPHLARDPGVEGEGVAQPELDHQEESVCAAGGRDVRAGGIYEGSGGPACKGVWSFGGAVGAAAAAAGGDARTPGHHHVEAIDSTEQGGRGVERRMDARAYAAGVLSPARAQPCSCDRGRR